MLKSLKIENYALIRSENIEFSKGFGVICGHTGASNEAKSFRGQRAFGDII